MSDEETWAKVGDLLAKAGFTTQEIASMGSALAFVAALGYAGESEASAEMRDIAWTPEKRAALRETIRMVKAARPG